MNAPDPDAALGCRGLAGPATALVGTRLAVLLDAPITDPLVGHLAGVVLGGRVLDDLVTALEARDEDLGPLPDLVAAEPSPGGFAVLARGGGHATRPDGTRAADGAGRRSWRETTVGGLDQLTLGLDRHPDASAAAVAAPGDLATLTAGVSPAAALHLTTGPAAAAVAAGSGAQSEPAEPAGPAPDPGPTAPTIAPPEPTSAPPSPGPLPAAPPVPAPTAAIGIDPTPSASGDVPLGRPVLDEHQLFDDTDPIDLDEQHLFDGTVIRATPEPTPDDLPPDPMDPATAQYLEDDLAAAPAGYEPEPRVPDASPPAPGATAGGAEPAPAPPSTPGFAPRAGGIIDAVPGFDAGEPPAPTPAPPGPAMPGPVMPAPASLPMQPGVPAAPTAPAAPPAAPAGPPAPATGGSRLKRSRLFGRRSGKDPAAWTPPADHAAPPPAGPAAPPPAPPAMPPAPPPAPPVAQPAASPALPPEPPVMPPMPPSSTPAPRPAPAPPRPSTPPTPPAADAPPPPARAMPPTLATADAQVDALEPATTALRPPSAEPTPPPATGPDPGDDGLDAVTVAREVVRARALAEPTDSAGDGLAVTAVLCDRSHANPPHYDRCRVCDLEILDRSMFIIRRPSLGVLRFSSGHTEALDRNLVIGRSPAPGLLVNDQPTRAVVLDSPDGSLSRTHAVVQIEGWQVQVVDRDSTNNTFVTVPGQPEFQLRPGEAFPIPPGTAVRLGDEIRFTFDAHR